MSVRLLTKLRQSLRRLGLGPGRAVVAVSGGPDSVALLHGLVALQAGADGGPLVIAHLNHQLRGAESDADEAFVRDLHGSLLARVQGSFEIASGRIDLAARAKAENLEAVARRVRYDWLAGQARCRGLGVVLTGHTADDQAETVLHRLLRGTGVQGLRGIAVRRPLGSGVEVVRPLLRVTRAEVTAYLDAERQPYRKDSSNADRRYTRNRIRHELLPLLAAQYNPAVARALCRLAEQAQELFHATEPQARHLLTEAELPRAGPLLVFDRPRLIAAPPYLVREALRLAWAREGWPLGKMGFREWDRLTAVVEGRVTAADFPGGVRARADQYVVRLGPGC